MSIYSKLYRDIIFPFYSSFIKKSEVYNEYSRSLTRLNWSKSELIDFQWQQLEKLLHHCWHNVPFYKEHWKQSGITDISEIKNLDDFAKLPVLTKQDVAEHYDQLIPSIYKGKNIKKATGGSTGTPFRFELNELSNDARQAIMWRGYGWLGLGLGVKSLFLWGDNIGEASRLRALKENLYHRFYNRKMVSTFTMNLNNLEEYITTINTYKPEAIISYVNPLYKIAQFINQNNMRVFSPKTLLTGAEPLYDFQRIEIEKAFNAKVYNTYGCREFMLIAAECKKQQGLHINIDHLVVETLNEKKEPITGEVGDIVITDLMNYGMPLIRYVNGDRATLSTSACTCGNPLPMIEKVNGRKSDVIKTIAGHMIPGELFPHLFKEFEGITKFQVKQSNINNIDIYLVTNEKFNPSDKQLITEEINKYSKQALAINFHIVDDIPLTSSGKYRVTISEL
ncbi:phenylacetate--CoA ligase family protein [Colwellia sp. MSW7]|uniref:Phenylacetate--CoA ligase family protein n=1 Tax=Colwellia maritima TaxID=2912588 RepID=A0ABS9WZG5_9GAMM|nr:phenylacetate--CoA ligase family protein [Colwellia maritima]MCI2282227.1 phenylacetate--CoA ligase family protein [Colwellia maritima]